jgi:AcrR family transcriptional regulator
LARGKAREEAILAAALDALRDHGYDAMTIDGIARRAHASKATIYRRWATKAEIVKAALDAVDAEHGASIPDTGALRSDLVAVMKALRAKATKPYVALMTEVVAAARRDKALGALLGQHVEDEELSPFHEVLRRAVRRRTLSRKVDTDLVHDVAEALVLRQLQMSLPFNDAFITRVVDHVLLPLLKPKRRRP